MGKVEPLRRPVRVGSVSDGFSPLVANASGSDRPDLISRGLADLLGDGIEQRLQDEDQLHAPFQLFVGLQTAFQQGEQHIRIGPGDKGVEGRVVARVGPMRRSLQPQSQGIAQEVDEQSDDERRARRRCAAPSLPAVSTKASQSLLVPPPDRSRGRLMASRKVPRNSQRAGSLPKVLPAPDCPPPALDQARPLVGVLDSLSLQQLIDLFVGERGKPQHLATRHDPSAELAIGSAADEQQDGAGRRLFQGLEEAEGRLLVEVVGAVDEDNLAPPAGRHEAELLAEFLHQGDRNSALSAAGRRGRSRDGCRPRSECRLGSGRRRPARGRPRGDGPRTAGRGPVRRRTCVCRCRLDR